MEHERVQHEATRLGYEEVHTRRGYVRARGELAYQPIYAWPQGPEPKASAWVVERKLGCGEWITASRDMQGRTLEAARNLVRGAPQYRVVVQGRPSRRSASRP